MIITNIESVPGKIIVDPYGVEFFPETADNRRIELDDFVKKS